MPTFASNFEDFIPEVQTGQCREPCSSHTWSAGSSISKGQGGGGGKSNNSAK